MAKSVKILVKVTRLETGDLWRRYERAAMVGDVLSPDPDRNWPSYEAARQAAEADGFEVID